MSSPEAGACSSDEAPAPPRAPVYNVYNQVIDTRNNMPATANQLPWPGQKVPLSTERAVSNIPKGGTEGTWVFPSPQMFYNALMRKGKGDDVTEGDMDSVVSVHNGACCTPLAPALRTSCLMQHPVLPWHRSLHPHQGLQHLPRSAPQTGLTPVRPSPPARADSGMNEMTWRQVIRWESLHKHASGTPKLVRFRGRPDDLSPRARVKSWFGGAPSRSRALPSWAPRPPSFVSRYFLSPL